MRQAHGHCGRRNAVTGLPSNKCFRSEVLIMESGLTIGIKTGRGGAVSVGMTSIATPLPVRVLVTTSYPNSATYSFYEQIINGRSTMSSMSIKSSGTAIADPLYVAWEASDLSRFPIEYGTSLAARMGVRSSPNYTPIFTDSSDSVLQTVSTNKDTGDLSPSTTLESVASSRAVPQTGSAADQSQNAIINTDLCGLSSNAKIGISVGVGLGSVVLLVLVAMALVIRRLQKWNKAVIASRTASTPAVESHDVDLTRNKWYQRPPPASQEVASNGPDELDAFPVQVISGPPLELEGSFQITGRS
jgi:hypothetical protein